MKDLNLWQKSKKQGVKEIERGMGVDNLGIKKAHVGKREQA